MEKSCREICRLCSKPANFRCSHCFYYYCSSNCQTKDWSKHMYECFPTVSKRITTIPIWQQTPSPPMGIYFKVVIHSIEEERKDHLIAWAVEINKLPKLQEIIEDSSYLNELECPISNLKEGCLAAAWFRNCYQRARVLHLLQSEPKAVVQFIDYGTVKLVSNAKLCPHTPLMEYTRALAFNIKLNKREEQMIQEGNEIWISLLDKNDGLFMADQMPTDGIQSLNFLTEDYTEIRLSKILDHNGKILVRLAKDLDEELTLPYQNDDEYLYKESPGEGCYVFALYQKAWHRACLVMWSDRTDIQHLVYFFDEGVMRFCKKLRPISTEPHQKIPMLVLMITLENSSLNIAKTLNSMYKENLILRLSVDTKVMKRSYNIANQPGLSCILYKEETKLCNAMTHAFQGNLEALDLKFWQESVEDGSTVIIKKCLNHRCIIVAPSFTKIYKELFTSMALQCPINPEPMNIDQDDIYLAYNPTEHFYFRARFLNNLIKTNAMVEVIDIDSGSVLQVKRSDLRIPNRIIRNCPIYLQNIQLEGLNNSGNVFQDNSALAELRLFMKNNREFIVKYNFELYNETPIRYKEKSAEHAKLFYSSNPNRTLNDDLIMLLKEDISSNPEIKTTSHSISTQRSSKSSCSTLSSVEKINYESLSHQLHDVELTQSSLLDGISESEISLNILRKSKKVTKFDYYENESPNPSESLTESKPKKFFQTFHDAYFPRSNLKSSDCENKNISANMLEILLNNRQKNCSVRDLDTDNFKK